MHNVRVELTQSFEGRNQTVPFLNLHMMQFGLFFLYAHKEIILFTLNIFNFERRPILLVLIGECISKIIGSYGKLFWYCKSKKVGPCTFVSLRAYLQWFYYCKLYTNCQHRPWRHLDFFHQVPELYVWCWWPQKPVEWSVPPTCHNFTYTVLVFQTRTTQF